MNRISHLYIRTGSGAGEMAQWLRVLCCSFRVLFPKPAPGSPQITCSSGADHSVVWSLLETQDTWDLHIQTPHMAYTYTDTHTCTYPTWHIHIQTHTHMYTPSIWYLHVQTRTHKHTCTPHGIYIYRHTHIYTHLTWHMHIQTHTTHMHTTWHIHIQIHTCTHIHINLHKQRYKKIMCRTNICTCLLLCLQHGEALLFVWTLGICRKQPSKLWEPNSNTLPPVAP